jgi:hypothetical protein
MDLGNLSAQYRPKEIVWNAGRFFKDDENPVLLVHDIFDSGKSYLLTVLALFLDHLVSELGRDDIRPIASKTNVNVGSI